MADLHFDSEALYTALDRERCAQRLRWRDIGREAGVSASTFTRLGHGGAVSATALVRLMGRLGVHDVRRFAKEAGNG